MKSCIPDFNLFNLSAGTNVLHLTEVMSNYMKKKKKKKKKIPHRQLGPLRESSSPLQRFEPARAKPVRRSTCP